MNFGWRFKAYVKSSLHTNSFDILRSTEFLSSCSKWRAVSGSCTSVCILQFIQLGRDANSFLCSSREKRVSWRHTQNGKNGASDSLLRRLYWAIYLLFSLVHLRTADFPPWPARSCPNSSALSPSSLTLRMPVTTWTGRWEQVHLELCIPLSFRSGSG